MKVKVEKFNQSYFDQGGAVLAKVEVDLGDGATMGDFDAGATEFIFTLNRDEAIELMLRLKQTFSLLATYRASGL